MSDPGAVSPSAPPLSAVSPNAPSLNAPSLIWAEAHDRVIGAAGGIPWRVPEDMAHFRTLTDGGVVVMGRRTWESLPERFRPLAGRRNIVVTRGMSPAPAGAETAPSLEAALEAARSPAPSETSRSGGPDRSIWIIGGGQLYALAIELADRLEVTELDLDAAGDTRAPAIGAEWALAAADPVSGWHTSAGGTRYRFRSYRRVLRPVPRPD